jgi:hypothetical protein
MASEKIGEDKIRFKTSWPNEGILDSVANTHLFLAWTAFGDGRLAIHLQCLAHADTQGPFGTIGDNRRSDSSEPIDRQQGSPICFEPLRQITRINVVMWS